MEYCTFNFDVECTTFDSSKLLVLAGQEAVNSLTGFGKRFGFYAH